MLVDGLALDIILNGGQGEGYESWRRLVLECDPRSRVHAASPVMEILSHPFTADSCSFEASDAKVSMHERRTTEVIDDDDVKVGCVLKNTADETLRHHLVTQSKLLTTYAMVRDEIMGVVQARAATGSSPVLVDALPKGKKGKGEGKDPKSRDDKRLEERSEGQGVKSQDSKDSALNKCRSASTATA